VVGVFSVRLLRGQLALMKANRKNPDHAVEIFFKE